MKRYTMWIKVWNAAIALALGGLLLGLGPSVWADDAQDATQLVDKARLTFEAFIADKDMGPPLRSLVKGAKGVLVYPQILRGAFIVGASGGSGVFLAKDDKADV